MVFCFMLECCMIHNRKGLSYFIQMQNIISRMIIPVIFKFLNILKFPENYFNNY